MTPKIKKAGTVPRRWVDPLSRAQRQSYITACNLASSHEELARRDRLGSVVRAGLDFEPRPSYSIATAEMTRECPDPFPAPTATESRRSRNGVPAAPRRSLAMSRPSIQKTPATTVITTSHQKVTLNSFGARGAPICDCSENKNSLSPL